MRKGSTHTPEAVAKIRAAKLADNPMRGASLTTTAKKHLSELAKVNWADPKFRQRWLEARWPAKAAQIERQRVLAENARQLRETVDLVKLQSQLSRSSSFRRGHQ